jgi:hypothetical protein
LAGLAALAAARVAGFAAALGAALTGALAAGLAAALTAGLAAAFGAAFTGAFATGFAAGLATGLAAGFAAAARVAGFAAVFGADEAAGLRGVVILLFWCRRSLICQPFTESYLGKRIIGREREPGSHVDYRAACARTSAANASPTAIERWR